MEEDEKERESTLDGTSPFMPLARYKRGLQEGVTRTRLELSCHRKLGTPQLRRDKVPPLAISASFYTIRFKRRASGDVTRNGKHGFTG
jgi:hypothetical protein